MLVKRALSPVDAVESWTVLGGDGAPAAPRAIGCIDARSCILEGGTEDQARRGADSAQVISPSARVEQAQSPIAQHEAPCVTTPPARQPILTCTPCQRKLSCMETMDLAVRAADLTDPESGLRAIAALRRLADTLELRQVEAALAAGLGWVDIADSLGVSRQAVHKKYRSRVRPDLAPKHGGAR